MIRYYEKFPNKWHYWTTENILEAYTDMRCHLVPPFQEPDSKTVWGFCRLSSTDACSTGAVMWMVPRLSTIRELQIGFHRPVLPIRRLNELTLGDFTTRTSTTG
jgi:hypothetical protein